MIVLAPSAVFPRRIIVRAAAFQVSLNKIHLCGQQVLSRLLVAVKRQVGIFDDHIVDLPLVNENHNRGRNQGHEREKYE